MVPNSPDRMNSQIWFGSPSVDTHEAPLSPVVRPSLLITWDLEDCHAAQLEEVSWPTNRIGSLESAAMNFPIETRARPDSMVLAGRTLPLRSITLESRLLGQVSSFSSS